MTYFAQRSSRGRRLKYAHLLLLSLESGGRFDTRTPCLDSSTAYVVAGLRHWPTPWTHTHNSRTDVSRGIDGPSRNMTAVSCRVRPSVTETNTAAYGCEPAEISGYPAPSTSHPPLKGCPYHTHPTSPVPFRLVRLKCQEVRQDGCLCTQGGKLSTRPPPGALALRERLQPRRGT